MTRKHFDFDDFDHLCGAALGDDARMAAEDEAWDEQQRWDEHDLPDPPEAA